MTAYVTASWTKARPGLGWGKSSGGVFTLDSYGTSRWLRGWPSMAIQSAAIIQGGPTSSSQQVFFFIMHSLSKTNVSCVCQLWCHIVLLGLDKYENFWVVEMLKGNCLCSGDACVFICLCVIKLDENKRNPLSDTFYRPNIGYPGKAGTEI